MQQTNMQHQSTASDGFNSFLEGAYSRMTKIGLPGRVKLIIFFSALFFSFNLNAQYLETFSIPNKGYLINCANDFTGVNWSLSAWDANGTCQIADLRDPTDSFKTTLAGVLHCNDLDQQVYWESPLINTTAAGTVSVHVDLTWVGFDIDPITDTCAGDFIRVLYSVNGGAYTMVPNQVSGSTCATIGYKFAQAAGQPYSSSTTVHQTGITGGSTLKIRVMVFTNANAEIVTIDNVSVPEAGVTVGCAQPVVSTSLTNIVCNGANSGKINVTSSAATPPYNVSWSGPSSGNPAGNEIASSGGSYNITSLAAGTYTVTVSDAASCSKTIIATVVSSPITQSASTSASSCSNPANGYIDLNVSGGNPGYTYSWSNGASTQDLNLVGAGNYAVTITDASVPACTSSATYSVASAAAVDGPYLETFTTANKGNLINQVNDFLGVNWTLSPWTFDEPVTAIGRDNGDYFQTTGGKLEAVDADMEICWLSPELNISASGTVQFSMDLSWLGFDNEDYISVQYSINGGAFVSIPNQFGGGVATVQYPFPTVDLNGSVTVTKTGLSGNKLQIKVCLYTNSQADVVRIDNVSVPQTVSLCFCPTITFNTTPANTCSGSSTGQIAVSAVSGGTGPYTYSKDNGTNYQGGSTFTGLAAGNYQVVVKDANGCTASSLVTINSNPSPSPSISGSLTFCSGSSTTLSAGSFSSYSWSNGASTSTINVTTAGSYSVTVTNSNGCTATAGPVTVTVTPLTTNGSVTTSICAGETYTWPLPNGNGQTYSTAQTNLTHVVGCNTATLNLTVTPLTTNGSVTTSICAGETYTWPLPNGNGQTYSTTQTNLTHVVGCNTATLNLTVTPLTTNGSVTTSICVGETYTWPLPNGNGQTYSTAQTNLTHVVGCNTATLNLTVTPLTTNGSVTTSICAGETYTWPLPNGNGQTYSTAQTNLTHVVGCNTATLNLTVTPLTTNGSVTTSICAGETYTWPLPNGNDQTYSTTQTNLTHVVGCNTATLNLTVTPLTTNGSVTTSICAGESYTWPLPNGNGQTYSTAQTNLTHVVGCNTATLNLTVTPLTTNGSVTTSICAGETYTWPLPNGNGQTYSTAQANLTHVVGCNTATLNLTINSSSHNVESQTVCDSYTWHGANYSATGTYTFTYLNGNGCLSTDTLFLTVPPGILFSGKAMLAGPYVAGIGLMHDSLRVKNLIPLTEPYTSSPYNKLPIGGAAGETILPSVLAVTGNDAIVDWVFLELRSNAVPGTVLANKRALIQRDGDIVGTDGFSPVLFPTAYSGMYYVSIKHRNHLGVMSVSAVNFNGCAATHVDFTLPSIYINPGIITAPRKVFGSVYALWSADANNNKNVKYNGLSNDKDVILNALGIANLNSSLSPVYRSEDLNMDGKIRYNNADMDRGLIIDNVGPTTPNTIINQHTPN